MNKVPYGSIRASARGHKVKKTQPPMGDDDGATFMIEDSTITCPQCGHQTTERMPQDACQLFYDCKGCGHGSSRSRVIVACSARMVRFPARRSRPSGRVCRQPTPAVRVKGRWTAPTYLVRDNDRVCWLTSIRTSGCASQVQNRPERLPAGGDLAKDGGLAQQRKRR